MTGSQYCFSHNPDTTVAKRQATIKGGKSPKKNHTALPPVELKEVRDVANLLVLTINEVRGGAIDLRAANCIGYLAGHLVKTFEISELEKRMDEIENLVNNNQRN